MLRMDRETAAAFAKLGDALTSGALDKVLGRLTRPDLRTFGEALRIPVRAERKALTLARLHATLKGQLYGAMKKLTDRQQEALVYYYGLGDMPQHTEREVANRLDISPPSAHRLLGRGLEALRRNLDPITKFLWIVLPPEAREYRVYWDAWRVDLPRGVKRTPAILGEEVFASDDLYTHETTDKLSGFRVRKLSKLGGVRGGARGRRRRGG